jgi:hypothetical protein
MASRVLMVGSMQPESTNATFALEAFLLAGPEGAVRLLVGDVYVDIDERDVVDLVEQAAPAHLDPQAAVKVSVVLAQPCRIHTLAIGRSLHEQLWIRPSPFAFASRAKESTYHPPSAFSERERAYIAELETFEEDIAELETVEGSLS